MITFKQFLDEIYGEEPSKIHSFNMDKEELHPMRAKRIKAIVDSSEFGEAKALYDHDSGKLHVWNGELFHGNAHKQIKGISNNVSSLYIGKKKGLFSGKGYRALNVSNQIKDENGDFLRTPKHETLQKTKMHKALTDNGIEVRKPEDI